MQEQYSATYQVAVNMQDVNGCEVVHIFTSFKMYSFYDLSTYASFMNLGILNFINIMQRNTFNVKSLIIKHNHPALCDAILGIHTSMQLHLHMHAHHLKLFSMFKGKLFSSPLRNNYECFFTNPPVVRYQILGELRTANFVLVGSCRILQKANSACILEPSCWFKLVENEMGTSY